MNRRSFLKKLTGCTVGLMSAGLILPYEIKAELIKPLAEIISDNRLDSEIRNRILDIKKKDHGLQVGELHCHSSYSDGMYSVNDLIVRASSLGLDFIVITEHLTPRRFKLDRCLDSIRAQQDVCEKWNHTEAKPPALYPAFEISTKEGHLIAVFPDDYFRVSGLNDIKKQFSGFDDSSMGVDMTAQLIREMGAVSIVAHPDITRSYPFGISSEFVKGHLAGLVDGIEEISAGHGYHHEYSEKMDIASIGSSDDHLNIILGTVVTTFDSTKNNNVIEAIRNKSTRAVRVTNSLKSLFAPTKLFFNI